jgi:hypothetical protein
VVKKQLKEEIDWIVRCGLFSGIPSCCIRYYVEFWHWLLITEDECDSRVNDYWNLIWKACKKRKIECFNRIPCPECLMHGKPIKLNSCCVKEKYHVKCKKLKRSYIKEYNLLMKYFKIRLRHFYE